MKHDLVAVTLEVAVAEEEAGHEAVGEERPASPRLVEETRLSVDQRRLWWLERLDPGDPALRLQLALELRSKSRRRGWGAWAHDLASALTQLAQRHRILRLAVPQRDGEPYLELRPLQVPIRGQVAVRGQVVAGRAVPTIDLSGLGLDGERRQSFLTQLYRAQAGISLPLDRGPLWRACWLATEAQRGILLLLAHRLIVDAASLRQLAGEVSELLDAKASSVERKLEAPAQYAQVVAQAERRWSRLEAEEVEFWRRQWLIDGEPPPVLQLPVDRPPAARSVETNSEARHQRLQLSRQDTARLDALARQSAVSWHLLVSAAFIVLLGRTVARGDDGPAFGRSGDGGHDQPSYRPWDLILGMSRPSGTGVVGPLEQLTALRVRASPSWSFSQLLDHLRQLTERAAAHSEVPLARLLERLRPLGWDGAPTPWVRVRCDIALEDGELDRESPPASAGQLIENAIDVDLLLRVSPQAADRRLTLSYRCALWDATTASRWLRQLETLLLSVSRSLGWLEGPLHGLPLLTAGERHAVVFEWQDTQRPWGYRDATDRLIEQARRRPDAVAVLEETEQGLGLHVSFSTLLARVLDRADDLRRRGVGVETRVGICLPRGALQVECLLAVLAAGGAYVPLDPKHPTARRVEVLRDASAALLLETASTSPLPEGCRRVDVGRDWPALSDQTPVSAQEHTWPQVDPEALAYVLYTSGSTGRPRGVMVRRGSLDNLLAALETAVYDGAPEHVRVAVNAPMVFDASVKQWVQVLAGRTLVPVPEHIRLDAEAFVAFLQRRHVDLLDCTPSHLSQLLEAGLLERVKPLPATPLPTSTSVQPARDPKLRLLLGGEEVPAPMWRDLRRHSAIRAWNVYGPTECTVDTTVSRIDEAEQRWRPDLGRPLGNVTVQILDGWWQPQPIGVPGELCIGGAGLARGYASRPTTTAERFVPDALGEAGQRLYRSGDLARWLPDGRLAFLGRIDFQVKVRGYRIELGEIEAVLDGHPAVLEAVVLQDDSGDLLACVLPQPGASPTAGDLRRFARDRLPDYMLPAHIHLLAELPLTANGKVDRKALARRGAAVAETLEAPATRLERQVAQLFARLLDLPLERVSRHDSFFDLGGDSFDATRLAARLPALAGLSVRLRTVFEASTPAALARRIERAQRPWAAPREALEELIADVVGDLLGRRHVSLLDDLESRAVTRQGIELAVALEQRLPEIFGLEITRSELAACSTVGELATKLKHVAQLDATRPPVVLEAAQREDDAEALSRLSFGQRELWRRMASFPQAAHARVSYRRLAARPGRRAAERTWRRLVDRHPLLRSRLHLSQDDQPHIEPHTDIDAVDRLQPGLCGTVDTSRLATSMRQQLRRQYISDLQRSWLAQADDLAEVDGDARTAALDTPLWRCCWIDDGERLHLVLALHPLIADRRTPELILDEFQRLYRRPETELAPVLDHRRLAQAQREEFSGDLSEAELSYWESLVDDDGVPWMPELPCDDSTALADLGAETRGVVKIRMPSPWPERLRQVALQQGATPWMVLAAALARVTAQRTGEADVALALPVTLRRAHTERLPGPLGNTLVVALEVLEEDGFRELLEQVWTATLAAFTCRDIPHGRFTQLLASDLRRSGEPVTPLGLSLHRPPAPEPEPLSTPFQVEVRLDADQLSFAWSYPADCWSSETARAWLDALRLQLEAWLG